MSRPHYAYPGNVRALTQAQVGELLARLRERAPRVVYAAAWTQYEIAGRVSEVLHLAPSDFSDGHVSVHRLKGSTSGRIRVSPELIVEVAQLARESGYVFAGRSSCAISGCRGGHVSAASVFQHVQRAGRELGIDRGLCRTHVLRHSAITHAAELLRGESLAVTVARLMDFSGHKNRDHLLHYLSDPEANTEFQRARASAFARTAKGPETK